MTPVLLWTDLLLFVLLGGIALFVWHARRHDHLRRPWRYVAGSRVGMATAVILSAYVVIGVLDSLHFQPHGGKASDDVLSLFDWLVGDLREHQEKTYSAPFSAWLYAKESIEQPDGTIVRAYPRLRWGGAALRDPRRERGADIARRVGLGAGAALLLLAALYLPLAWRIARRDGVSLGAALHGLFIRRRGRVAWPAFHLTMAVLVVSAGVLIALAAGYHVFGTDKVGEDVFYQALKSIRTGLLIGTLTTLVMLPAALLLGILAGYYRGWIDDLIQYLYTTLSSIPGVLLIAAAILMLQVYMAEHAAEFDSLARRADLRLLFLCVILGITSWTTLCRLLRGETLKLRELEYVQAARAFGVRGPAILSRHILPNVMHIVLISIVLDFSGLVLAEAVLAYVNIGVDPTMNSWGNMINSARLELAREPIVWWSLAAAFVFMFVLVLAANLFADVVRDAFDPRLGRGRG